MNANVKADVKPVFSSSFDAKIKDAIGKVKGISFGEKLKLYQSILGVCHRQVEDCCDCLSLAIYLNLNDLYGLGQKRINRLQVNTQRTLDEYSERYDIGMLNAMLRELKRKGIIVKEK